MNKHNNEIFFSSLSGYNYYMSDGSIKMIDGHCSLIHCQSNENVILKSLSLNSFSEYLWRYFLSNPPTSKHFLWPEDIVWLNETSLDDFGNYGIIFDAASLGELEPLSKIVFEDNSHVLDYRDKNIQKLIISLLESLSMLEESGYVYNSYDINRIHYNPKTMDVYFSFSTSTVLKKDTKDFFKFFNNDVSIDFLPPWVNIEKMDNLNIDSANYSFAALLFRLMVGRLPYQGSAQHGDVTGYLMKAIAEEQDQGARHFQTIMQYRNVPIFVFDPSDNSNDPGARNIDRAIAERWESLPVEIRSSFQKTFSKGNINCHYNDREVISLSEWSRLIKELYKNK